MQALQQKSSSTFIVPAVFERAGDVGVVCYLYDTREY